VACYLKGHPTVIPPFLSAWFDHRAIETEESTLVALDAAGQILWVNAAWERFALANDGADVARRFGPGTSYLDGMAEPFRSFFNAALSNTLMTGEVFESDYECSSTDTFRMFHMRALPIEREGLLLEHSLVVEHPHVRLSVELKEEAYVQPNGMVLQCGNCRRIRRAVAVAWDWIPAWVRSPPPRTSHGICNTCLGFYWGRR
jgi:hypothetical protein